MLGTTGRPPLAGDRAGAGADARWWEALEPLDAAARAGDSTAQSDVLARLHPLIAGAIAQALRHRLPAGVEPADVEQEAAAQACALIRDYDPRRGASLPVYVGRLLKWRLANYLRAEARRAAHAPLEAARLDEIADEAADTPEPCLEAPHLRRALRRLSPRQRAVIAGIYWRERTARQVAAELGVTSQAVNAARRKAEDILRRELSTVPAGDDRSPSERLLARDVPASGFRPSAD
jgi:RNA polymerase sigma factor (sigma-70 family)